MKAEATTNKKLVAKTARLEVKEDGVLYVIEYNAKTGEITETPFLDAYRDTFTDNDLVDITITSKEVI